MLRNILRSGAVILAMWLVILAVAITAMVFAHPDSWRTPHRHEIMRLIVFAGTALPLIVSLSSLILGWVSSKFGPVSRRRIALLPATAATVGAAMACALRFVSGGGYRIDTAILEAGVFLFLVSPAVLISALVIEWWTRATTPTSRGMVAGLSLLSVMALGALAFGVVSTS
jgi:MFS family permease